MSEEAAHDYQAELYDSLHDSPMQRKLRRLRPMPFGVVFLPWVGMTEAEMRQHFRWIRELGFTNLKQTMGTPEWPRERVLEVALDEGILPFWYGEGGWEEPTLELLERLGRPARSPTPACSSTGTARPSGPPSRTWAATTSATTPCAPAWAPAAPSSTTTRRRPSPSTRAPSAIARQPTR